MPVLSIETRADRRWSALGLIVVAQFMVILDVAIVNVALPSIKTDLGFSETTLQWVVSAYAIIFGGGMAVLIYICAPSTWQAPENRARGSGASYGPSPAEGPQKQTIAKEYIYKNEGGRNVKYERTVWTYK